MAALNISKIGKHEWRTKFVSGLVKVEIAEIYLVNTIGSKYEVCSQDTYGAFETDVWRITNLNNNKAKVFYGETAWMDARRYATDLDFGAWGI